MPRPRTLHVQRLRDRIVTSQTIVSRPRLAEES
jgi:hypothetical protein